MANEYDPIGSTLRRTAIRFAAGPLRPAYDAAIAGAEAGAFSVGGQPEGRMSAARNAGASLDESITRPIEQPVRNAISSIGKYVGYGQDAASLNAPNRPIAPRPSRSLFDQYPNAMTDPSAQGGHGVFAGGYKWKPGLSIRAMQSIPQAPGIFDNVGSGQFYAQGPMGNMSNISGFPNTLRPYETNADLIRNPGRDYRQGAFALNPGAGAANTRALFSPEQLEFNRQNEESLRKGERQLRTTPSRKYQAKMAQIESPATVKSIEEGALTARQKNQIEASKGWMGLQYNDKHEPVAFVNADGSSTPIPRGAEIHYDQATHKPLFAVDPKLGVRFNSSAYRQDGSISPKAKFDAGIKLMAIGTANRDKKIYSRGLALMNDVDASDEEFTKPIGQQASPVGSGEQTGWYVNKAGDRIRFVNGQWLDENGNPYQSQ